MRRWIPAAALAVALGGLGAAAWLPGRGAVHAASEAAATEDWSAALDALAVDEGTLPPSATALHDAGVAWFRLGDHPRALAHWAAARDLAPRDADLVHDVALARSLLQADDLPTPAGMPLGWMEVVTPGEVGGAALLLWLLASWSAVGWRRGREQGATAVLAGAAAVLLSGAALQGRAAALGRPPAVVLVDSGARDGASLDAGERFALPPGSEVRAERVRDGFALVEDGDGRRGWVPLEALSMPLPPRATWP